LCHVAGDRLSREDAGELLVQARRGLLDVVPGDGIENLGHGGLGDRRRSMPALIMTATSISVQNNLASPCCCRRGSSSASGAAAGPTSACAKSRSPHCARYSA